jgi:hypothetical protein
MTHSELQGKIRIKLKIAADLGSVFRVGFLLCPAEGQTGGGAAYPFHEGMIKRYNKCKLFR